MTTKLHSILSELHRMLSLYSSDDFEAASKYTGASVYLREALSALTRESRSSHTKDVSAPVENTKPNESKKVRLATAFNDTDPAHVLEVVMRSRGVRDKGAIGRIARSFGLDVRIHPKDSKQRLARKLATAIAKAPPTTKQKVLNRLYEGVEDQTEGWISVIRNGS